MIADLEKLVTWSEKSNFDGLVRSRNLANIPFEDHTFPIHSFTIGSREPTDPVLFVTGGVHGIERVGAQLAWSLLKTTLDRLVWDRALRDLFTHIRLVVIPLLNPVGYVNLSRGNGNHVDLMRNSPIDAIDPAPWLLRGHRISPKLPWFRGRLGELEAENLALEELFLAETKISRCKIALDFHSGFGMRDRLWFPFSHSKEPFGDLPELQALVELLEQSHPYHIYKIEPQSDGYLLHGDMWDYLYLNSKKLNPSGVFLPITLEMGSWSWVRKNPWQLFSRDGVFNPVKLHRLKRTFRRHHLLFDFLLRALNSSEVWASLEKSQRIKHQQRGLQRWYHKE